MNNLLINNLYGILLFDNYFSIISENILVNNSCAIQIDTTEKPMNTLGISQWPTYITVSNNHITDSKIAITIEDASLNVIKNNTIDNNEQGVFIYGTYGWGCDNTLERNYISNNDLGIDMLSGIMGGASGNKFYQNTFLENTRNVRFALYDDNNWEQNYWGRARFIPYPIFGWKHPGNVLGDIFLNLKIPWIEIDWHPAQEPYDIP
jgi:parallel beta-helix repeat protein